MIEENKNTVNEDPQEVDKVTKGDCLKTAANKNALIAAMNESLGIVSTACKKAGLSRKTFYKYTNEDKEFKKACQESGEIALDFAESKLFQAIKEGNMTGTIFFLKTKGKKRGYIESSINYNAELDDKDKQAMKIGDNVILF